MGAGKDFLERMMQTNIFGTEPMPGQTLVEWLETCRVRMENHCGVTAYSENEICVRARRGQYRITGTQLYISSISVHSLVISGRIWMIQYDGGAD